MTSKNFKYQNAITLGTVLLYYLLQSNKTIVQKIVGSVLTCGTGNESYSLLGILQFVITDPDNY
jgi:hypothetical protein